MALDHFSFIVPKSSLEGVVAFLASSLQHMGFKEMIRPVPYVVGMGDTKPFLWIACIDAKDVDQMTVEIFLKNQHIAFTAENVDQVQQFHAAALKAGGIDNGAPGLRCQYHPGYYGAFVLDPVCGINFEVVCHNGAEASKSESGD